MCKCSWENREESLKLILSTFFVHSFPSHLCDPIYRFVTLTITKLCSWEHCTKIVTSISTARKIPHSWNFIIENSRQFLFKTKDLLLQKVLISKFLEHDGIRVLSSALFSSCMIGYTMMTTLSWQKFLLLQRS